MSQRPKSDLTEELRSYFNRLNPLSRFSAMEDVTIDRDHAGDKDPVANPVSSTALTSDKKYFDTSASPGSLKILSWNIAKNNQSKDWSQDFLSLVERYQPDKIFLQEVRLCAERKYVPELSDMGWSFAPNFIDTFHNAYSGVLIATKADRINSQSLVTNHTEPVTNTPKVSLFAEYSLCNRTETLLAVNTHLINFVELRKFTAQLQAVEAALWQHSGAIVFSGDFNTWNRARRKMLFDMTTRLGLTPVSFTPEDTQKIKNFLTSPPLDYIFYRGFEQKPHSATVIDTITSSDHNPLLVELCY